MRIRGVPGRTFWTLDGDAAARAVAAASEVALLLDAEGVIHDVLVQPGTGPARELAGWPGWAGRPWAETVLPASVPTVEALIRAADMPTPAAAVRWLPVSHDSARDGEAGVPVLYAALRLHGADGAGPILAVGRDLLGLDLVGVILAHDPAATRAYIAALRARGTGAARLCLDVLAPAARRLGALWAEDRCDFTQVTDGVGRLREALRGLRPGRDDAPPGDPAAAAGKRVLLAPVPGEQHGFGLHLVAAFLGWAGFQVTHATPADEEELAALVRRGGYALVGLSASGEARLAAAASAVRRVRRAAAGSAAGMGGAPPRVMVGGRIFTERPSLARQVGADATAVDAQHAAVVAWELLSGES